MNFIRAVQSWLSRLLKFFRKTPAETKSISLEPTYQILGNTKIARDAAYGLAEKIQLRTAHRDRFQEIGEHVVIWNSGDLHFILEGPLTRRIEIPPGKTAFVRSPLLEMVQDRDNRMMIREWDALYVVEDLIFQWVLSSPLATVNHPCHKKHCELMFTPYKSEALNFAKEELKLEARRQSEWREGEGVSL